MTTPALIAPRLDWLNIGKRYSADREAEILDRIAVLDGDNARACFDAWLELKDGLSLPMAPGLAIQEVIAGLKLPRVTHVALLAGAFCVPDGGETAHLSIYGIRAHYGKPDNLQRIELFVADHGDGVTPLVVRVWPKPSESGENSAGS